jgi:hypothetical protein
MAPYSDLHKPHAIMVRLVRRREKILTRMKAFAPGTAKRIRRVLSLSFKFLV